MFLSRNKKNNVYPCIPKFYYIKVGFKGEACFRDEMFTAVTRHFTPASCSEVSKSWEKDASGKNFSNVCQYSINLAGNGHAVDDD